MIEGAEILKKTEIFNSEPSKLTMVIGIISAILVIVILIFAILSMDVKRLCASILAVLSIGIIGMAVLPITYEDVPAGYQYDVYAEEAEVIKALYDKYEIVSANGNIYTVKEKAE